MLPVADTTGSTPRIIDVELVHIFAAIAKIRMLACLIGDQSLIVTIETQGVSVVLVRDVKGRRKGISQNIGEIRSVRLMTGAAIALFQGTMERFGVFELRGDIADLAFPVLDRFVVARQT